MAEHAAARLHGQEAVILPKPKVLRRPAALIVAPQAPPEPQKPLLLVEPSSAFQAASSPRSKRRTAYWHEDARFTALLVVGILLLNVVFYIAFNGVGSSPSTEPDTSMSIYDSSRTVEPAMEQ